MIGAGEVGLLLKKYNRNASRITVLMSFPAGRLLIAANKSSSFPTRSLKGINLLAMLSSRSFHIPEHLQVDPSLFCLEVGDNQRSFLRRRL